MLDFIGIGLGPFNLSLASLLEHCAGKNTAQTANSRDVQNLSYVFFEQKAQFDWHAGMQLPNTVLQVPFMADLVSMVDPTSPFSFLNYLRHQQRLYKFYFLEQAYIPRSEYNHYCQWVAEQLDCIEYQSTVLRIEPQRVGFKVWVNTQGVEQSYLCRHLVIGSGNVPNLPECLQDIQKQYPQQCLHAADYMSYQQANSEKSHLQGDIVVLGSGQSAAEVFIDLFDRQIVQSKPTYDLHWLTRSKGFFPMEYAPLGLEHFSPDYTQHFYALTDAQKQQTLQQQGLLYKGISAKTIRDIYQRFYHRSIAGQALSAHLHSQCQLVDATRLENQKLRLHFQHLADQQQFYLDCDGVIAATGYRTPEFAFMQSLKPHLKLDENGRWQITADYRIVHDFNGHIFVQNQEMHSHGVATPDLGMGAYRAATIVNQLFGKEVYALGSEAQTFQHFQLQANPKIRLTQSHAKASGTTQSATQSNALKIPPNHFKTDRNTMKGAYKTTVHSPYEKLI